MFEFLFAQSSAVRAIVLRHYLRRESAGRHRRSRCLRNRIARVQVYWGRMYQITSKWPGT